MRICGLWMAPAIFILVILAAPRPSEAAVDPAEARSFMNELGQRTIAVLRRSGRNQDVTVEALRNIFRTSFDVTTIGRFVLGRYWNSATPTQQQEYLRLFEEMVVEGYARRFGEYTGEVFQVGAAQPIAENDVVVATQILRPDGPPVPVNWRLRERNGRFQVIDVEVEGVSMLVTQRSEFSAIIQRHGGRVEALLDAMRQQVADARR